MEIGEIFYLYTDGMYKRQYGDKWLKITSSPRSTESARPFIYIQDGHNSDFAIMVPISETDNERCISIDSQYLREARLVPNSKIMSKEVWEIPKSFIQEFEHNTLNGNHKKINLQFLTDTVKPILSEHINKIMNSYEE